MIVTLKLDLKKINVTNIGVPNSFSFFFAFVGNYLHCWNTAPGFLGCSVQYLIEIIHVELTVLSFRFSILSLFFLLFFLFWIKTALTLIYWENTTIRSKKTFKKNKKKTWQDWNRVYENESVKRPRNLSPNNRTLMKTSSKVALLTTLRIYYLQHSYSIRDLPIEYSTKILTKVTETFSFDN